MLDVVVQDPVEHVGHRLRRRARPGEAVHDQSPKLAVAVLNVAPQDLVARRAGSRDGSDHPSRPRARARVGRLEERGERGQGRIAEATDRTHRRGRQPRVAERAYRRLDSERRRPAGSSSSAALRTVFASSSNRPAMASRSSRSRTPMTMAPAAASRRPVMPLPPVPLQPADASRRRHRRGQSREGGQPHVGPRIVGERAELGPHARRVQRRGQVQPEPRRPRFAAHEQVAGDRGVLDRRFEFGVRVEQRRRRRASTSAGP